MKKIENLKRTKQFFLLFFIGALFYSCSQEEQIEMTSKTEIQQTKNFVSLKEVSSIASAIEYPLSTNSKNANLRAKDDGSSTFKEIEKVFALNDNEGNPFNYIVNYKDDGFIIFSADNRIVPIQAFSLTGKFPIELMESKELPSGLLDWFAESSDIISEIRVLDEEQTESVAQSWNTCEIQKTMGLIDIEDNCGENNAGGGGGNYQSTMVGNLSHRGGDCTMTTVGPLLQTSWGQKGAYNDKSPLIDGCSSEDGRAPTGCVATAMAQIMRFHEFPRSYDWDAMPDHSGSMETARLMRDIGDAVNMTYGCLESTASIIENFESYPSDFGYSVLASLVFNQNLSVNDQELEILKREIDQNRPVTLVGADTRESSASAHSWVCDGYKELPAACNYQYMFLHMNWGWNNESINTWYNFDRWTPRGTNTDYGFVKLMLYNIRP